MFSGPSKSSGQSDPALEARSVLPPITLRLRHTLNSCSEFGKLRSVIVGSPQGANHPEVDSSFANFFTPPVEQGVRKAAAGPIPAHIINEIAEDIEAFVDVLTKAGVEVLRPDPYDSTTPIKSPDWETSQLYSLMPRDCLFVHGHLYLEVPSATRARFFEPLPFRAIADAYERHPERGAILISAPKPRLLDNSFDLNTPSFLPNTEILFDGANCVRMGRDIFIDINNSANMRGRNWLQQLFNEFGWGVRVHPMHLGQDHADVTLVPLRPGVILVNPYRVNDSNLPQQFKGWTRVGTSQLADQTYGLSYPMASKGIGRNVFMLDENTAIVEKNQISLIKELEALSFQVIPLQYRHGRTLGGSWHCITLDTNRDGGLENYFSS